MKYTMENLRIVLQKRGIKDPTEDDCLCLWQKIESRLTELESDTKKAQAEYDAAKQHLEDLHQERADLICAFDVGDTVGGEAIGKATAVVQEIRNYQGAPEVDLLVTGVKSPPRTFNHVVVGDEDCKSLVKIGVIPDADWDGGLKRAGQRLTDESE